ncbi:MAG: energy-coupling factor transporter ATPase [Clostridium sp.]|nr:energy-coupling factor transporter ATPase [Clostridium sp.]MDD7140285.1 energy-coupling factor transporter ATPase [Clostridium sp.]
MLELNNVSYRYEGAAQNALSGVTMTIEDGEMLAIVGHNGSGKSTLAKHLNGLLLPTGGNVTIDGMDTKNEDALLAIRQRVGMVFQNPDNQLVTTIVEEDVGFGPENLGVPPKEIRGRVDAALESVGMTAYADKASHALSGGQKQRIAIAGMLAMQPEVLVLDEATAMLDPEGRREVLEIVKRLHRETGLTVVMITQFMEETLSCDRVVVMGGGKLQFSGTPREVFRRSAELRALGLDVPEIVWLRDALIEGGMPLLGDPMTITETADAIWQLLSNN